MPIDASIPLQVQTPAPPNQLNMMTQVLQAQGLQSQNAMAHYGLAKAQRQDQQTNALMAAIQGGQIDPTTDQGLAHAFSIAPESPVVANLLKARVDQSTIKKNTSQAGNFDADAAAKTTQQYRDALAGVNTPEQAAQWMSAQYADPTLGKFMATHGPVEAAVSQIPTDPQAFAQWKQQQALGMAKFIELNKPTQNVVNTGGVTQIVQTPGLGGPPQVVGTMTNTVSPDASLSSQTQLATNAATNATSRANTAANIQKDYNVAGVNPDGTTNNNVEQMAQAIAAGKAAPITGFALAKPQGQTVMRRVFELNPGYDETTYTAKNAAAKAFTSGQQGNALRSVATANAHLDQMNALVDALNNGQIPIVNQIANAYQQQTGNPAPTNFNAVKNVVGQEVVKAIVAGGGSAGERDEAAAAFSSANSPQQLKQAIQHYRMVMGAQQANLLEQRRAAGLPDSTLPNYNAPASTAGAAPAAPAGWQYLGVQK